MVGVKIVNLPKLLIQAIVLCYDQLFDKILSHTKFDTVEPNDSEHFEVVKHFINLLLK